MTGGETNYLELDIGGMDGLLPLGRTYRVVYWRKFENGLSPNVSEQVSNKLYPDGEIPTGYKAVAIRSIVRTSTQYLADETEGKINGNENTYMMAVPLFNNQPSGYCTMWFRASQSASAAQPVFVERTVTYVLMPTGCI